MSEMFDSGGASEPVVHLKRLTPVDAKLSLFEQAASRGRKGNRGRNDFS